VPGPPAPPAPGAAGPRVCAAADGKVTGTGTKQIGLALTAAAKADDVVEIALD